MKTKLEMDDIRVGMFVTILRGKRIGYSSQFAPDGTSSPIIKYDSSYNGKVIKILAVNFPYVVTDVYRIGPIKKLIWKRQEFDLREIILQRIDKEYIKALCPGIVVNHGDSFWDDIEDTSLEDADTTIEEIFKDL